MSKQKKDHSGLVFVGMGFELVAVMLGGLYLGQMLDQHWETGGLVTAGLSLLLLVGWLWHVIVLLKRFEQSKD